MDLPKSVSELMDALEDRGFQTWAVGGCVRDDCLGIPPHDFDLCTAALPEQTQQIFSRKRLVLAGLKHGTVGVVTEYGVVEITTFRTEGDYTDSRHPGWVRFVPDVDEDLARRDFTVNAMAYSPRRGYRDPFGGLADLKNHVLRAVGDPVRRFREDALRILRGARFAARFDLKIEENTWNAMLSELSGVDSLARERVMEELTKLICLANAGELAAFAPIITRVIPELEESVGLDQRSPHHAYDVYTHTAHVTAAVPAEPALRFAALLHDVGKPRSMTLDENGRGHFKGHAQLGAQMANEILHRLKAPNALREEAVWLIEHHMSKYPPEEKSVRRALSKHGLPRMERLICLQKADFGGKGVISGEDTLEQLDRLQSMLEEFAAREGEMNLKRLAVKGGDLISIGVPTGRQMGKILNDLLQMVLSGELPNDRDALLTQAEKWIYTP